MSLIEFQIYSACKIAPQNIGKVQNRQTTQGLASFCFFHQNILFFSCRFFSISLKPLSLAFLISHRFSAITGRYFHPSGIRFTLFNQKFMLEHLYYTWGYRKRKTCQEKTNMLNGYSFMIPLILWQST